MRITNGLVEFAMGISVVKGFLSLFRRGRNVNGLRAWQRVYARRNGAEAGRRLAQQTRQEYAGLMAQAQLPANRMLRWHLTAKILPGLALYRALLKLHNGDRPAALAALDEIFRVETAERARRSLAPMGWIPAPFAVFRLALPLTMAQYPAEGWDTVYTVNTPDEVAFDITRCFYVNTLTALGAPELTASFCKTDDVMADCFPRAIRFIRPRTLGRGDAVCDFRYCRVKKG